MRMPRETNEAPARNWIELGPEVAARMALVSEPAALTVAFYTLTRGAERAWSAINSQLTQLHGEFFWIGGAAGTGKTHFLNYAVALSNRAAASDTASSRYLTVTADAERAGAGELDRQILDQLAPQLAGDSRGSGLWRRVDGPEGLTLALDYARRQGVKGVMAAIDLGEQEATGTTIRNIQALAKTAREFKHLRLILLVAGRAATCEGACSFVVAPDEDEELTVICGRVRRINESALPKATAQYRNLRPDWEPRQIYPLHPAAAEGLKRFIAKSGSGIAAGAAMLREALVLWDAAKHHDRLLMPADLMRSTAAERELEHHLGEAGTAGLTFARQAVLSLPEPMRIAGYALIDALALAHLSDSAGVELLDLLERLPADAAFTLSKGERLVVELAARTQGIIRYEMGCVYFNPGGAGTHEITAFNRALGLTQRFDPSLTAATDIDEFKLKARRFEEALARAVERCYRVRNLLATSLTEGGGLSSEHEHSFEAYRELAESGTAALIGIAADPPRHNTALKVIADYEAMAAIALAAPRLRDMREYLDATGLAAHFDSNSTRDRAIAAVETECQLLKAAVAPAALVNGARNLEALEARFHQFKWSYSQLYREAHLAWCGEMKQLDRLADETRFHFDALRRLNGIPALGEATGQDLGEHIEAALAEIRHCDPDSPMVLEVRPLCPQCDFVIGSISSKAKLEELLHQTRRGLDAKLARLSQSTIARLIEENGHNGKLEGFLKITQAAQTEALVRVLDDKLTAYLAELLNEDQGEIIDGSVPRVVVASNSTQPARAQRLGVAKNPPRSSSRR